MYQKGLVILVLLLLLLFLFTRCSVPIQPHMSTRRSLSPPEGEPNSKRQDLDADSTNSSEPILEVVESDESPPPSPVESSRQPRDQPSTPGSSKSGISNSVSVCVGGVITKYLCMCLNVLGERGCVLQWRCDY